MSTAATPFNATIDEDHVQGWVAQSKKSYRAWGTFRGREIVSYGRTSSEALNRWRDAATHAAND